MDNIKKIKAIDVLLEDLNLQSSLIETKVDLNVEMQRPLRIALEQEGDDALPANLGERCRESLLSLEHQALLLRQNLTNNDSIIAQYAALRTELEEGL